MTGIERVAVSALRLVAVTDSLHSGVDELVRRGAAAAAGGATMITLRLPGESPRVLAEAARGLLGAIPEIPLLVSGRVDVALAVGAAGVHVGPEDLRAAVVRRFTPERFIIGASVGTPDEVMHAESADFVAIGPVFTTTGVPTARGDGAIGSDGFSALAKACGRPAVAFGGVSPANAGLLISAGASGVAVISALFGAHDPASAARALRSSLDASGR